MPDGGQGGWHLIVLRVLDPNTFIRSSDWIAALRFASPNSSGVAQNVVLVRPTWVRLTWRGLLGLKLAIAFIRPASDVSVHLYGLHEAPEAVSLGFQPLPRLAAVGGVLLQSPRAVAAAFKAVSGKPAERLRKAFSAAAIRGQEVPQSYSRWTRLFDTWPTQRIAAVRSSLPGDPVVAALVFGAAGTEAYAATLASLKAQAHQPSIVKTAGSGGAGIGPWAAGCDWIAVLQAGEVLPPHALLVLLEAASHDEALDVLYADEDMLLADGSRGGPLFKPQPSLTLMCSGLLSRGIWLIRPALLQDGPQWAECMRLQVWFQLHAEGRDWAARRVPHLLTHRRADAEAAPSEALAGIVNAYLQTAGVQAQAVEGFPLRLHWTAGDLVAKKVSIVVPSRLKGRTQMSCLASVLPDTRHPNLEMLIVVTQDAQFDEAQMRAADQLRADPRVRVETLRRASFNYSAANNFAAGCTESDFICLLNDDVSPLEGGWLERMVAVFSDPKVGIVGAKLYYPNMTVQHGGIIMGLSGLVEHASRFLPRGSPGYAWRGVLDQEFSSVTGACMLVRRSLYDTLGGLDEALPTGFNDVDFCLRARRLGWSVVFAANAELIHHETITFGHHYAADRVQEAADISLMQERWAEDCRADPFHNPNQSLLGGSEWTLAYPPRVGEGW